MDLIHQGLLQFMLMIRRDSVKVFDVVLLKDGRQGTILEVYEQGKAYLIEIADEQGRTLDLPTIQKNEIEKVVYVA